MSVRIHYTSKSEIQIGNHVFPTQKYRLIREALIRRSLAEDKDFMEPGEMGRETMELVHSSDYLDDFLNCRNSWRTNRSELPLRPDIVGAYTFGAQATVEATHDALCSGTPVGINVGGGFHHAFADHAEGFCYLNDVAIAIRKVQKDQLIQRAMVLDLDVHQGNGTASIFHNDPTVFTFSMHQENNYPPKQNSDLDIGLDDGIPDDQYLAILSESLTEILDYHQPQLVQYLAGADPYWDDQLGGLALTIPGLSQRDRIVLSACQQRNIPVVITLAGGYARTTDHTIAIHENTLELALQYGNHGRLDP